MLVCNTCGQHPNPAMRHWVQSLVCQYHAAGTQLPWYHKIRVMGLFSYFVFGNRPSLLPCILQHIKDMSTPYRQFQNQALSCSGLNVYISTYSLESVKHETISFETISFEDGKVV
jgi:hypothetical protein